MGITRPRPLWILTLAAMAVVLVLGAGHWLAEWFAERAPATDTVRGTTAADRAASPDGRGDVGRVPPAARRSDNG